MFIDPHIGCPELATDVENTSLRCATPPTADVWGL